MAAVKKVQKLFYKHKKIKMVLHLIFVVSVVVSDVRVVDTLSGTKAHTALIWDTLYKNDDLYVKFKQNLPLTNAGYYLTNCCSQVIGWIAVES